MVSGGPEWYVSALEHSSLGTAFCELVLFIEFLLSGFMFKYRDFVRVHSLDTYIRCDNQFSYYYLSKQCAFNKTDQQVIARRQLPVSYPHFLLRLQKCSGCMYNFNLNTLACIILFNMQVTAIVRI